MLALLSTILSWDDHERERAGLQRGGPSGTPRKGLGNRKASYAQGTPERSPEDQAIINEVRQRVDPADSSRLAISLSSSFSKSLRRASRRRLHRQIRGDLRQARHLQHWQPASPALLHSHVPALMQKELVPER